MSQDDLKRLILGFALRIQTTFTASEAFEAIKEAPNRSQMSALLGDLYYEGKLFRRKIDGRSYSYAVPAFAPAVYQNFMDEFAKVDTEKQEIAKSHIEKKTDESIKPAEPEKTESPASPKAPEFVPTAERKEEIEQEVIESDVWDEMAEEYMKSIEDNIPETDAKDANSETFVLPNSFKLTFKHPNGMSIIIETRA